MLRSKANILFQISGSIAAFKSCELISRLVKSGHTVQVVTTRDALQFIGPATLEGLSGRPALSTHFESGHMMDHIELTRWADLAILAPATAHTINRLSTGLADDLIGALFLAYPKEKPYLLAPAMNTKMYQHPTVQRSLAQLSSWGITVLPTASGSLACGEVGEGRLLEVDHLEAAIRSALESATEPLGPLLITSGATCEPIDSVRFITNFSSGKTGAFLAEKFIAAGFKVTYLHGTSAARPQGLADDPRLKLRSFTTFSDLDNILREELSHTAYSAIIHLAAVSDYSVSGIRLNGNLRPQDSRQKISSDSEMEIVLSHNPKLLNCLKAYSKSTQPLVVGFKLTSTSSELDRLSAVSQILRNRNVDFVVHNDMTDIQQNQHRFQLYTGRPEAQPCSSPLTREELSANLVRLVKEETHDLMS